MNPAEYSETFASEAAKAVTRDRMRNPVDVIVQAHEKTRVIGSSTACVCVVDEGEATFANLGDAGDCREKWRVLVYYRTNATRV